MFVIAGLGSGLLTCLLLMFVFCIVSDERAGVEYFLFGFVVIGVAFIFLRICAC